MLSSELSPWTPAVSGSQRIWLRSTWCLAATWKALVLDIQGSERMQPKLSFSEGWVPGFSHNWSQAGLPASLHSKWGAVVQSTHFAHFEDRDGGPAQQATLSSFSLVLPLGHQHPSYLSESWKQKQKRELDVLLSLQSLSREQCKKVKYQCCHGVWTIWVRHVGGYRNL